MAVNYRLLLVNRSVSLLLIFIILADNYFLLIYIYFILEKCKEHRTNVFENKWGELRLVFCDSLFLKVLCCDKPCFSCNKTLR